MCSLCFLLLAVASGCPQPTTPRTSPNRSPHEMESPRAFTEGQPCPSTSQEATGNATGCETTIEAELDGDGQEDAVVVQARLDDAGYPVSWSAIALMSDGQQGEVELEAPRASAPSYLRALAAHDLDADGSDEVLIGLSRGAAVQTVAVLAHGEGGIGFVRRESTRAPFLIHIGGSGSVGAGGRCIKPGRFQVHFITRTSANKYEWRKIRLAWETQSLRRVAVSRGELEFEGPGDRRFKRFFQLRCDGRRVL